MTASAGQRRLALVLDIGRAPAEPEEVPETGDACRWQILDPSQVAFDSLRQLLKSATTIVVSSFDPKNHQKLVGWLNRARIEARRDTRIVAVALETSERSLRAHGRTRNHGGLYLIATRPLAPAETIRRFDEAMASLQFGGHGERESVLADGTRVWAVAEVRRSAFLEPAGCLLFVGLGLVLAASIYWLSRSACT